MLIYTCRSRGNNCACIINDSFHPHVRFRVFEANQLQKHHCYLTSIYCRCQTSPQDLRNSKYLFPSLVLFLFTLTLSSKIVKLHGIWNCGRFLPSVCQQKVRERVASQICGLYCGRVLEFKMHRHSKTSLHVHVSMSFTTPTPSPTYVPTSPSLVLFLHLLACA